MTANSVFTSKEQMLNKIVKLDVDFPKITLSIKLLGFTVYFNFSKSTTQEGFTSLLSNGKHLPLLDADNLNNADYNKFRNSLKKSQKKHNLSNWYLVSDKESSYRAFCFSEVSFKILFDIMNECFDYLDWSFIRSTAIRGKATLRSPTSNKIGRMPQKIIECLESYYVPIPLEKMECVIYDTSTTKKGIMVMLGDKGKVLRR